MPEKNVYFSIKKVRGKIRLGQITQNICGFVPRVFTKPGRVLLKNTSTVNSPLTLAPTPYQPFAAFTTRARAFSFEM